MEFHNHIIVLKMIYMQVKFILIYKLDVVQLLKEVVFGRLIYLIFVKDLMKIK
jgi:hypothetical protein